MKEFDRLVLRELFKKYGLKDIVEELGSICFTVAGELQTRHEYIWLRWETTGNYLKRVVADHVCVRIVSP